MPQSLQTPCAGYRSLRCTCSHSPTLHSTISRTPNIIARGGHCGPQHDCTTCRQMRSFELGPDNDLLVNVGDQLASSNGELVRGMYVLDATWRLTATTTTPASYPSTAYLPCTTRRYCKYPRLMTRTYPHGKRSPISSHKVSCAG